jgi:hypothetical protein
VREFVFFPLDSSLDVMLHLQPKKGENTNPFSMSVTRDSMTIAQISVLRNSLEAELEKDRDLH